MRLGEGKFREPDVVFMLASHADRKRDRYWDGADLVMEVVSEDDPDRDRVEKVADYATAGVPEYWVVDPTESQITVMRLSSTEGRYETHGTFRGGAIASSVLLPGFSVDPSRVFAAAKQ